MSIIRERIRLTNNDIVIKIPLSSGIEFTGQQQEIDKLTNFSTFDVVNPPVDGEKTRFRFNSTTTGTISFEFYRQLTNLFIADFRLTVFTFDEVEKPNPKVNNSFFIMDVYDSFDTYSQNKLFSAYLTKIIINEGQTRYFLFDRDNQWNKIAVPNSFINEQNTNQVTGYTKFTFYDGKTGRLIPFFNWDNNNLTTPERYYIRTVFNFSAKTYRFQAPNVNDIRFREIRKSTNELYVDKVNNTVDNFEELRVLYPTGNTFNPNKRDYEIT